MIARFLAPPGEFGLELAFDGVQLLHEFVELRGHRVSLSCSADPVIRAQNRQRRNGMPGSIDPKIPGPQASDRLSIRAQNP